MIENLNQNKYYKVEYDHEVLNYSQNIFENKDITDLATVIISPVVYVDPKDETTGEDSVLKERLFRSFLCSGIRFFNETFTNI